MQATCRAVLELYTVRSSAKWSAHASARMAFLWRWTACHPTPGNKTASCPSGLLNVFPDAIFPSVHSSSLFFPPLWGIIVCTSDSQPGVPPSGPCWDCSRVLRRIYTNKCSSEILHQKYVHIFCISWDFKKHSVCLSWLLCHCCRHEALVR